MNAGGCYKAVAVQAVEPLNGMTCPYEAEQGAEVAVAPAQVGLGLGLPVGPWGGPEPGRGLGKPLPALAAGSWSQASCW